MRSMTTSLVVGLWWWWWWCGNVVLGSPSRIFGRTDAIYVSLGRSVSDRERATVGYEETEEFTHSNEMRAVQEQRPSSFSGRVASPVRGGAVSTTSEKIGASKEAVSISSALTRTSAASEASTMAGAMGVPQKRDGQEVSTTRMVTPVVRVAFQGESGAYSEKALRELLGKHVISVPRPSFDDCYRAVGKGECEYALLPVENSLGGSIHENYDLMLRYNLVIIAEHEFRVQHCLLVHPDARKEDIKYCISHPQALAQCANYLRGLGIKPVPTYDTAGSAKMIADTANGDTKAGKRQLPEGCTPANTAAVASDFAGQTYGLRCLQRGIEDDDTNFTRFLLLGRRGVLRYLQEDPTIPAKTSVVFTLPNQAGALYKALACFSLRDIDFSKIESRPTSASLLNFLKFRTQQQDASQSSSMSRYSRTRAGTSHDGDIPRFRYCFYLDFLASELDEGAKNALRHLREQADYCRILGSYPQKSRLVGPISDALEDLTMNSPANSEQVTPPTLEGLPSDDVSSGTLRIGVVGGDEHYSQVLAEFFASEKRRRHEVRCLKTNAGKHASTADKDSSATRIEYFEPYDTTAFLAGLDVVVVAPPLVDFEDVVVSLPADQLRGKLVVEACPLSVHPKRVLLEHLSFPDVDILSTHPMLGSSKDESQDEGGMSGSAEAWEGQPMVYEKVRVTDLQRCDNFLSIFEDARCQMVEMTAELHDENAADAHFITHLTGRLLAPPTMRGRSPLLPPTPVTSREYASLQALADVVTKEDSSFDLFYGMFKYNSRARHLLNQMRENLATVERELAAREAYLQASNEMKQRDRKRLVEECKSLLMEMMQQSGLGSDRAKSDVPEGNKSVTPATSAEYGDDAPAAKQD